MYHVAIVACVAYHNMAFFEQIFRVLRPLLAKKKSDLRRGMFY